MLTEIILSTLAEQTLGAGIHAVRHLLTEKAARTELASIRDAAVEAAVRRAPALGEDLRSPAFIEGVADPIVLRLLADPSSLPDPDALAAAYVDVFVARFAHGDVPAALRRIFRTEPTELRAAFVEFFSVFRRGLVRSKHFREVAHQRTGEDVLRMMGEVHRLLTAPPGPAFDVAIARADAVTASADVRAWARDIMGEILVQPALGRLLERMEADPSGTTLLVGEPGSGKSAVMSGLVASLEASERAVFAIKADALPATVLTLDDVSTALGIEGSIPGRIAALAAQAPVTLIIDQLDAVSDVMDRSSQRMRLLIRLVGEVRTIRADGRPAPVHVVVSSRPFEAAHDARFRQLGATEVRMELPDTRAVTSLLGALGIEVESIQPALLETIRRPFALRLYVDIVRRGGDVTGMPASALLDRWLEAADLGDRFERAECIGLMESLAREMVATETLWRPADVLLQSSLSAFRRCEAAGLIVASAGKVAFAHQSWLDDFQARSFGNASQLVGHVWRGQDGLFVRATLLRALERLRAFDPPAYAAAVDALLGDVRTRRHVRHLVVDVLAARNDPSADEIAWVGTLLVRDRILAARALEKIVPHWGAWRISLRAKLPDIMTRPELRWLAVRLLVAEMVFDPDGAASLVDARWVDPADDGAVFAVLDGSLALGAGTLKRLEAVFRRGSVERHAVAHVLTGLRDLGRFGDAVTVFGLWLRAQTEGDDDTVDRLDLYELEKLAQAAPVAFAEVALPWFVARAASVVADEPTVRTLFPRSRSLPWHWDHGMDGGSVYQALRMSMAAAAAADPRAASAMVASMAGVAIDEVQQLAAETLAAGADHLAAQGLAFLLADDRRLCIGGTAVTVRPGVTGSVPGLATQRLIGAIAPFLDDAGLLALRDRIEGWSIYRGLAANDAATARRMTGWADGQRMPLLERLPPRILSARRRRQIAEWRAANPRPLRDDGAMDMAVIVGSPMSDTAMSKARDADIAAMLDEVDDAGGPWGPRRSGRPLPRDGGAVELGRAFAAFARTAPERAVRIARARFAAGRHETVAADLVQALVDLGDGKALTAMDLIAELGERGFGSSTWRQGAASALRNAAIRLHGLPESWIRRLEGWIDDDPAAIAARIEARTAYAALSSGKALAPERAAEALIFGRFGGMRMLPHGNFTILSAISAGLTCREQADVDGWLGALERHALRPEDPATWTDLLLHRAAPLFWADRDRVQRLLGSLWSRDPAIFDDVDLAGELWPMQAIIPEAVLTGLLRRWQASADRKLRQAAGEFAAASFLVRLGDAAAAFRFGELTGDAAIVTGVLFAAAAGWSSGDPELRRRSHDLLMPHVATDGADHSKAIAVAVGRVDGLEPDDLTAELLTAIAANDVLLRAALGHRFADGLRRLLVHDGFDALVLGVVERAVGDIGGSGRHGRRGLEGRELVEIAVALQRNDGPLRARAMDAYERLLDADVHGAEEAARAAGSR